MHWKTVLRVHWRWFWDMEIARVEWIDCLVMDRRGLIPGCLLMDHGMAFGHGIRYFLYVLEMLLARIESGPLVGNWDRMGWVYLEHG